MENLSELIEEYKRENGITTEKVKPKIKKTIKLEYNFISFSKWVTTYKSKLSSIGISRFMFKTDGIDNEKNILLVVKNEKGFDVHLVKPKKKMLLPDLPPESLSVMSNDLIVINHDIEKATQTEPGSSIKTYVTQDIVLFNHCIKYYNNNEYLNIPHHVSKMKRGDTMFTFNTVDKNEMINKLKSKCNLEDLTIIYPRSVASDRKKSTKKNLNIITWLDAVSILIHKQSRLDNKTTIRQIDDAIVNILGLEIENKQES